MLTRADTVAMEGAVVICPECHARIGVLRKSLYQGFNPGLDAFSFDAGQAPDRERSQAACRQCGASYAEIDVHLLDDRRSMTLLVYTEHGWLPKPPPNVPAPLRVPIVTEASCRK